MTNLLDKEDDVESIDSAPAPTTMTAATDLPKRGGKHPILGLYVGGSPLNLDYSPSKRAPLSYRSSFQVRTSKAIAAAEKTLYDSKRNINEVKFHGHLELPKDSIKASKELDKVDFLKDLDTLIGNFGLESFFYLPLLSDMKYLVDDSHHFTVDDVIREHNDRLAAKATDMKSYDVYEICDIHLSRIMVESLISRSLDAKIKIRYGHYTDYKDLPGSIFFMMILDICNSSADLDIETASDSFTALSLLDFPGENIEDFATEALRLIKIMQGGYALPYNLGSDLINKVCETSCPYFNRTMFSYMDEVRRMEDKIGASRDPSLLTRDHKYKEFGPVPLCALLQTEYATMTKRPNGWPALSAKLPQVNYVPDQRNAPEQRGRSQSNVRFNIEPPRDSAPPPATDSPPTDTEMAAPVLLGAKVWKFIAPRDENQTLMVNDKKYSFCRHCKCPKTQKIGMYTTTHSTKDHTGAKRGDWDVGKKNGGRPDRDKPAEQKKPDDGGPKANLSRVTEEKKTTSTSSDGFVDSDPHGLEFDTSAYCTEIIDGEDGIWMATAEGDDDDAIDFAPPAAPTVVFLNPIIQAQYESAPNVGTHGWETPASSEESECIRDNYWHFCTACYQHGSFGDSCLCGHGRFTLSPVEMRAASLASSSSEESAFPDFEFGQCHSCDAMGQVYNKCDCEDIFQPISSAPVPSSGPSVDPLALSMAVLSLEEEEENENLTSSKTKSSSNAYMSSYFEFFDAVETMPSLESFCDSDDGDDSTFSDCITELPALEHDDSKDDLNIDDSDLMFDLEMDPVNPSSSDIFYDAVSEELPLHLPFLQLLMNTVTSFITAVIGLMLTAFFYFTHGIASSVTIGAKFIYWLIAQPSVWSHRFYTWLLFISAICWDSVHIFAWPTVRLPSGTSTRRYRRYRKRHPHVPLVGYPKRWMILSCLVIAGSLGVFDPLTSLLSQLQNTYSNMDALHAYVDVDLPLLCQYHTCRLTEYSTGKLPTQNAFDSLVSPLPVYLEPHTYLQLEPEELHFFDAYDRESDMCTLTYFDTSENLHDLPDTDIFHDCPYSDPAPCIPELIDISDLCATIHHVHGHDSQSDFDATIHSLPSPAAYNAATSLMGTVDLKPRTPNISRPFSVIFDSGASLAISPSKDDFVGPIQQLPTERRLGGMAAGMLIEGIGTVRWTFQIGTQFLVVNSRCYYVPDSKARLISPQRLFNKQRGIIGSFLVEEEHCTLTFKDRPPLIIDYDTRSHLPIGLAKNHSQLGSPIQANLAVLSEENQNLSPGQKLLLEWHARFGHKSFQSVQRILRHLPFQGDRFKAATKCICPKCEICEFAKAHRQPTHGNKQSVNIHTDGALKDTSLQAGQDISADHFESRLLGRTLTSFGRTTSPQYKGGCIFVDHMSGYIHVEHQIGFSSSETIRAKQNFEKLALDHGVIIQSYHADNGTFKANAFVGHIREHNQKISYCGVNAHHKNAVAERSIRTVSECARAMLLHAALHWKSGIDSSLWPMAVSYATYIYNHLPNANGIAPADLFTGTQIPRHKLRSFHVWGCPVYVLDPTLQQGKKLPRWEPRARRGIFVGYSSVHSSDVPLVLNLHTGHISPQYYVVFDDSFSTVPSLSADDIPPAFWNAIDLDTDLQRASVHRIHLDDNSPVEMDPDYMTPLELEERERLAIRTNRIRESFTPPEEPSAIPTAPPSARPTVSFAQAVTGSNLPVSSPRAPAPVPSTNPTSVSSQLPPAPALRRSSRSTKGKWTSKRLSEEQANYTTEYVDVFLSSVLDDSKSNADKELSYRAELETDFRTGEVHCTDPRAYLAKTKKKKHDADNPTYHDAMTGAHSTEYQDAMCKEIKQLILQNTWKPVNRSDLPKTSDGKYRKVLKGTWAFKLKRLPDGSPLKFKARYCVRGDLQTEGVDYFETYAPVVQWSTVRLLLTMVLSKDWVTKQVDYTNAFAQATLEEDMYIESPKGFSRRDKVDKVLKLIKSLYGLKQAPKTFFEKLRRGLLQRGFTASELDPCLFMKHNMIVVVYVDDTIIAGPDPKPIEDLIHDLGVGKDEHIETFMLRDEGSVGDFLGIRIEKCARNTFKLSQTGLIEKVIKASGMTDCNTAVTPASTDALGTDKHGENINESWEYPEIVGMLMFLATNSRPDIAYAVNQCARFTHDPKASHATAVKRIVRYLKGTRTEGMYLKPNGQLQVDCYVDADFAGLWKVEDDQDPISVKSRSGYLIMFMGCPFSWSSKLQTQIALSTMESEYIALSQAMRELIACREVLKEIHTHVLHDPQKGQNIKYHTIAKTFGEIPMSIVHEDNEACLKFATTPKMSPRTKHIAIPYL